MTLKVTDFEAGPEGATLTAANTGLSQVTPSGGTAVFSKTVVRSGALGGRFNSVANALCIGRSTATASNTVLSENVVFALASTPNVILGILSVRGSGVAGRLNWNTDNSLTFVDASLSNTLTIATGLVPGTVYEVSVRARSATSTTGTVTVVLYNAAGTEIGRATSSTYNLGTVALTGSDVGILNTNAAANSLSVDYLQLDDGNTAELRAPQSSPAYSGTATLTGTGTLTGAGAPATSATGALSGTGTLTGTGSPRTGSSAALSGGGSLTASGIPATAATASLSSTGSITGMGAPRFAGQSNVTGTGILLAAARAVLAGQVDLAGAGALTGYGTPAHAGTGSLSGEGLLDGGGIPAMAAFASLGGTGTLTGAPAVVGHDITVTSTLGPRRHGSTLVGRRINSSLGSRRWESHL